MQRLRKRSIFIATPMYDGLCTQGYFQSTQELTNVCWGNGITMRTFALGNESLIPRARNYCVDWFMRSGFTHLMFIDADIEFHHTAVLDLLALAGPETEFDIVCAPYPKKCVTGEKIIAAFERGMIQKPKDIEHFIGDFAFNVAGESMTVDTSQPFEITEGGTGFMMIQRHALERIADKFPDLYYKPDHKRDDLFDGSREIPCYFDCEIDRGTFAVELWDVLRRVADGEKGVKNEAQRIMKKFRNASGRYLSEDYMFCRMAREAGLKVWMVPWVHLAHHGRYAFRGNLSKMLAAGQSPTLGTATPIQRGKLDEPDVLVPFS